MSDLFRRDVRYAFRRLRAAPGPTIFAIVTLALGIAVTVATFSVVYRALWMPFGVPAPDRLLLLGRSNSTRPGASPIGWAEYSMFARDQQAAQSLAAWVSESTVIAGRGTAELATIDAVSGTYFDTLGVAAAHGRVITAADDREDAPHVLVLADATWRTQFNADPAIVGAAVKVGGATFQVVGIAPPAFRALRGDFLRPCAGWIPLAELPVIDRVWRGVETSSGVRALTVIGRLAPGATRESATADWARSAKVVDAALPLPPLNIPGAAGPQLQGRYWKPYGLDESANVDSASQLGRAIVALPTLILLIACTNIANLVLSRGVVRRQEFGVRRALGGSRWRLIREQVIEQAVVVFAGGLAGVALAFGLLRVASRIATDTIGPFIGVVRLDFGLDGSVVASAAVAGVLCLLVAGVIPALHLTRDSLRAVMAQGDGVSTPRWRGRANLIAVQVGVSVGLFLVAIIFVRLLLSQDAMKRVAPQAPAGSAQLAYAAIPFDIQNRDADAARTTAEAIASRLATASDVSAAAAMTDAELPRIVGGSTNGLAVAVTPAGAPFDPPRASGIGVHFVATTPGSFAVLDRALLAGRDFAATDTETTEPVAIVNEGLAMDLFGTTSAVGRRMDLHDRAPGRVRLGVDHDHATIIGIAAGGNVARPHDRLDSLFVPLAQQRAASVTLVARSRGTAIAPIATVRAAIKAVDPELAVSFVARGDALAGGPFAFLGAVVATLVALASLALGLAMAGLYGVLSHVVARRTREMGIRFALGAEPRHVSWLVIRDGFRPIVEGLFIGLASATVIRLLMKRALLDSSIASIDPLAFAIAAALLFAGGMAASYLPARRASEVSPTEALRQI